MASKDTASQDSETASQDRNRTRAEVRAAARARRAALTAAASGVLLVALLVVAVVAGAPHRSCSTTTKTTTASEAKLPATTATLTPLSREVTEACTDELSKVPLVLAVLLAIGVLPWYLDLLPRVTLRLPGVQVSTNGDELGEEISKEAQELTFDADRALWERSQARAARASESEPPVP